MINELKNGKASDIPIALIKASCNIIAPFFVVKLYNISLNSGVFPKIFKISKITIRRVTKNVLKIIDLSQHYQYLGKFLKK